MQDNNAILDAVERYIRGEMLPEEQGFFEHVRSTNPDVDQLVIEHTQFLKQFTQYGETAKVKKDLEVIHQKLADEGQIGGERSAIVVTLWKKYKRTVFVAAAIAGITALFISGLIAVLSPKVSPDKVDYLIQRVNSQGNQLNNITHKINSSAEAPPVFD